MGIPGDIGIPATENLRLYLSQATLPLMKIPRNAPPLPPSGHRSHNIGLTTRPERHRRLGSVRALRRKVQAEVSECMYFTVVPSECERFSTTLDSNKVLPDYPLEGGDSNSETGNAIRIPCNPTFDIPQPHMIPPTDLDRCVQRHPLNHRSSSKNLNSFFLSTSASHPGLTICHCKRRNALCISCIPNHGTGPSSSKVATWMTRTLSTTHGSWHLTFLVPAGGKRPQ